MQADIKQAIKDREYSEKHFDVLLKYEVELLLKSTAEFESYEKDKELKRNQERLLREKREDRIDELLNAEAQAQVELEMESFMEERSSEKRYERLNKKWLMEEMARDLVPLRTLLGLTTEEMENILGISASIYKSFESGKRPISWDMYMALLFVFHYNERTAPVVDTLGLYPDPLKLRMRKGIGIGY